MLEDSLKNFLIQLTWNIAVHDLEVETYFSFFTAGDDLATLGASFILRIFCEEFEDRIVVNRYCVSNSNIWWR